MKEDVLATLPLRGDEQLDAFADALDSDDDPQNGRTLPLLGSFPGDVMRHGRRDGKALVCNVVGKDARFGSWQYKEMQGATGEALGVIVGVPLQAPGAGTSFVYEAYGGRSHLQDWDERGRGG